jgi:hypothetical protein
MPEKRSPENSEVYMTQKKSYIKIKPNDLPALAAVLQKGFWVEVDIGCSIRALLCSQWKLSDEYVDGRISTIFIDSKPVDDLGKAVVEDGATLALSCAMPGLVGAVMRRGGLLSSFRSGISYSPTVKKDMARPGCIRVKLFNMLIKELGPGFLKAGIGVEVNDLDPGFRNKYAIEHLLDFEKIGLSLDI